MSAAEQIRTLRDRLSDVVTDYPATCRSIAGDPPLAGARFFPGGGGLWGEPRDAKFPYGGVLILGSDFGDTQWYDEQRKTSGKKTDFEATKTALGLKKILSLAEIDRQSCFYTNAWPCLRVGNSSTAGSLPDLRSPFSKQCLDFFEFTLDELRPKVVVPLGVKPAGFVACIDPKAFAAWIKPSWRQIDTQPVVCVERRRRRIVFVPVTHPSMNNRHNRPKYNTIAKEAALLQQALSN